MTEAEWNAASEPFTLMEGPGTTDRRLRHLVAAYIGYLVGRMDKGHATALADVLHRFATGDLSRGQLDGEIIAFDRRSGLFSAVGYPLRSADPGLAPSADVEDALYWCYRPFLPPEVAHIDTGVVRGHLARAAADGRLLQANRVFLAIARDVLGNPFRSVVLDSSWLSSSVLALANRVFDARDFGAMPVLADALIEAGCANADILDHCKDPHAIHVRGCWVVDLLTGKP